MSYRFASLLFDGAIGTREAGEVVSGLKNVCDDTCTLEILLEGYADMNARFGLRRDPHFGVIECSALRKFEHHDMARCTEELLAPRAHPSSAPDLGALRVPPGNRLEALKGDRKGQWSIRINSQWRICLRWKDRVALDVESVEHH